MNETTKGILATITIVAVLTLIGVLAYLRVEGAPFAAVSAVGVIIAWLTNTPPKGPPSAANAIPLLVAGALVAALVACGCSSAPPAVNVENAAAVAQYEALLADCRAKGKAAQSYDVYENCKDVVNAELCRTAGLRCKDGGL